MNGTDLSVADAALLLGVSSRALYARLREIGWLHIGNARNGLHNIPRTFALKNQWLRTESRGFKAPYNATQAKIYQAVLITQKGFQELKKYSGKYPENKEEISTTTITTTKNETAEIIKFDPVAAQRERDIAFQQLKEWGMAG